MALDSRVSFPSGALEAVNAMAETGQDITVQDCINVGMEGLQALRLLRLASLAGHGEFEALVHHSECGEAYIETAPYRDISSIVGTDCPRCCRRVHDDEVLYQFTLRVNGPFTVTRRQR